MIDPAMIAKMDQAQAAFGTWAELLVTAWQELAKRGVPTESALGIATEWVNMAAQHSLYQQESTDA